MKPTNQNSQKPVMFSTNSNITQTNQFNAPTQINNQTLFGATSKNTSSFNNCNKFIYFSFPIQSTTSSYEFPTTSVSIPIGSTTIPTNTTTIQSNSSTIPTIISSSF